MQPLPVAAVEAIERLPNSETMPAESERGRVRRCEAATGREACRTVPAFYSCVRTVIATLLSTRRINVLGFFMPHCT
jgi:hypothetical protein